MKLVVSVDGKKLRPGGGNYHVRVSAFAETCVFMSYFRKVLTMTQVKPQLGCIDKKQDGTNGEVQLWMETQAAFGPNQFRFVVRRVDLSAGGRRCELDSGFRSTYDEALTAGQASLAIHSAPPTA